MVKKERFNSEDERMKSVSIIIPVYNGETYIQRCIISILNQTYKEIEVIIVDDGSVDRSYEICEKIIKNDERCQIIRQENRGVVEARKKGLANSKGEYTLFVDADDWIESNMVEELLLQIEEADMISSGVFLEKYPGWVIETADSIESGKYKTEKEKQFLYGKMIFDLEKKVLHPLSPWMCNKLYKTIIARNIFEQMDDSIYYAEDAVFVYSYVLQANSIVITHKPYYHYCYNSNSACHKKYLNLLSNINKVYLDMCRIFEEAHLDIILFKQLQAWITFLVKDALNEKMDFYDTGCIPDFLLDARQLGGGKRFILYGAGRMGEDFANQLKKLHCEIVLWVDGNYQYWQSRGRDIASPDKILECDYDKVLVAVSAINTKNEIKNNLVRLGVEEHKIILLDTIIL